VPAPVPAVARQPTPAVNNPFSNRSTDAWAAPQIRAPTPMPSLSPLPPLPPRPPPPPAITSPPFQPAELKPRLQPDALADLFGEIPQMPPTGDLDRVLDGYDDVPAADPLRAPTSGPIHFDEVTFDEEMGTEQVPSPIMMRLRLLGERLRTEGREADADIVAQAVAMLELARG
jgi:hypothetical protein